jgi:hypothetical protein
MAEVVPLRAGTDGGEPAPSLQDIPAMLELLAARFRAGEAGDAVRCALVLRCNDRPPTVFGWGDTDSCRTFEDLHLGAARLLAMLDH